MLTEEMPVKDYPENVNNGDVRNYMPQLDSLRTFAVFFVLLVHWLPGIMDKNLYAWNDTDILRQD